MRIRKQLIFFIPFVIVGCQGAVNKKQNQFNTRPQKEVSCDSNIINNEFSFDVLAFKVFKADTTKIKSLFSSPVVLKLESKKDSEGETYYLYSFTDGMNKLTLFSNDGFYLEEGYIKNDKIHLNKKISIGMTKDSFLKLFKGTNITCDTVTIENDESTIEAVYIFKDSKLIQIKMGQILE